jgi:hypothetical protein
MWSSSREANRKLVFVGDSIQSNRDSESILASGSGNLLFSDSFIISVLKVFIVSLWMSVFFSTQTIIWFFCHKKHQQIANSLINFFCILFTPIQLKQTLIFNSRIKLATLYSLPSFSVKCRTSSIQKNSSRTLSMNSLALH